MGIVLNLQIAFGKIAIFTMLILPIHEHGRSFHLLRSSLISFFKDLKFLSYRYFTSSVRVTPRYFILFATIVKGVVSLISFSAYLFFVQRKATDLIELILYSAIAPKLFIRFRSSLVEFLGSLIYIIISSVKRDIMTSSFPVCIPLISFCCLIALARTSRTILNRQGESGQPYLVPNFSAIASSFSPFSLMLATGLLYIAFIMFRP